MIAQAVGVRSASAVGSVTSVRQLASSRFGMWGRGADADDEGVHPGGRPSSGGNVGRPGYRSLGSAAGPRHRGSGTQHKCDTVKGMNRISGRSIWIRTL
jgi:hypothetical protein